MFDEPQILFKGQYGFRGKHFTQHAILDIDNTIQDNVDNKSFSPGIFLDLKKAYDMVDHSLLLYKLDHYKIRGIVNLGLLPIYAAVPNRHK